MLIDLSCNASDVGKIYAAAFSLCTFLVGLIVGNRLAIGRDKRKEFNDLSVGMFVDLNNQLKDIRYSKSADTKASLLLEPYFHVYTRMLFRRDVYKYTNAPKVIGTYDEIAGSVTADVDEDEKLVYILWCTKKLLRHLNRR